MPMSAMDVVRLPDGYGAPRFEPGPAGDGPE